MGHRITGIGAFGYSVSWERTEGDDKVARAVVTFLEDRRLLFGRRHLEDEGHCVASALEIRGFLTDQIIRAKPGKSLEASLRAMRAACRRFMEEAGPNGRNFWEARRGYGIDTFSLALGDLRMAIGMQLALIASEHKIPLGGELGRILPAADEDD